jgi:hypothetical protein
VSVVGLVFWVSPLGGAGLLGRYPGWDGLLGSHKGEAGLLCESTWWGWSSGWITLGLILLIIGLFTVYMYCMYITKYRPEENNIVAKLRNMLDGYAMLSCVKEAAFLLIYSMLRSRNYFLRLRLRPFRKFRLRLRLLLRLRLYILQDILWVKIFIILPVAPPCT